jgi:hypothetical protein
LLASLQAEGLSAEASGPALLAAALSDGDTLALTAEERAALIGLLRRALDEARYPLSRRYDPIKAILAKLEPPGASACANAAAAAGNGPDTRARKAETVNVEDLLPGHRQQSRV